MATKTKTRDREEILKEALNGDGKPHAKVLTIQPLKQEAVKFKIEGHTPLVMNAFSEKARNQMKAKQVLGDQAKKSTKREAKDFEKCYEDAKHVSTKGWIGIPATAFRASMISACRLANFKMTHAKQCVFIEADGYDRLDGTPLVRITKGEPKYVEHAVRNDSGVADIRARPMWEPGWEAVVTINYDAELFTHEDVANLLNRAGRQVGILEGRPDSKNSCGQGWGQFRVVGIVN